MTLLLCLLTGSVYPGVVTGLAQMLFPWQANGSLVQRDGHVVGSALIGQPFARPEYFHSAALRRGRRVRRHGLGGHQQGPDRPEACRHADRGNVARVVEEDGAQRGNIPSDMVTASASGLDPHISPANAELQVARVARSRSLSEDRVRAVLREHTERRQFGFLGEPRVNVLLLNLALDSLAPARSR